MLDQELIQHFCGLNDSSTLKKSIGDFVKIQNLEIREAAALVMKILELIKETKAQDLSAIKRIDSKLGLETVS